jgi:hypothetical protein
MFGHTSPITEPTTGGDAIVAYMPTRQNSVATGLAEEQRASNASVPYILLVVRRSHQII